MLFCFIMWKSYIDIKKQRHENNDTASILVFMPLLLYLKDSPHFKMQVASSVQKCFPESRPNPVLLPESFCSCTFGDVPCTFSPKFLNRVYHWIAFSISNLFFLVNPWLSCCINGKILYLIQFAKRNSSHPKPYILRMFQCPCYDSIFHKNSEIQEKSYWQKSALSV